MLDDLRFAWRGLLQAPAFAAVAILTLALAIGANTAVFSIADAVLFRPLPYEDSERVHIILMRNVQSGQRWVMTSYEHLQAISDHHRGLGEVGMLENRPSLVVATSEGAEALPVVEVSANYFQVLGARAHRGRVFGQEDDARAGRAAVLPFAAWRQRFGGDEGIIGREVTLGTTTFDIVGVLPPGFVFPSGFAGRPEIVTVMAPVAAGASGGTFHAIVRRDAGVTREQAQAEIDALIAPLVASLPPGRRSLPCLEDIRSVLYPTGRPIMWLLVAAAGLVLLLGCANLANALMTRAARRERDTGVRVALGAGRLRLMRPVVLEAVLIGLAGAALAVLATSLTFEALLRQVPRIAYGEAPVGVGSRVVWFSIALGLVAGVMFAAVPAWRCARLDVQVLLQGRVGRESRRRGRLGGPMTAVQVALAIVLVFGAVVAGRAFLDVLRTPLGFTPDNVIVIRFSPQDRNGLARQDGYVRALEAIGRRADVVSVGAAGSMPLDSRAPDEGAFINGERLAGVGVTHVLPGYFETVGIRLVRGRLPNDGDVRSRADIAVVSEAAAQALAPGRDPLGAAFDNGRGRRFTVVGVVSDVRKSLDRGDTSRPLPSPAYAIPGDATRTLTVVARTRSKSDASLAAIKSEIGALVPGVPVTARWWTEQISSVTALRNPRFQTLVLGSFAGLALVLMAVGVFGAVGFLVAVRTREMGIRLAIGAHPESLVRLMVRQSLVPVGIGILGGVLLTRWLGRLAEAQLFDVQARDPITLAAAVVTVVLAALVAAYLPARQASRVDPIVVLRAE